MKKCTLMLNNPDGITRHNEPVIARLFFKEQPIDPSKLKLVNEQGKVIPHQLFDIVYDDYRYTNLCLLNRLYSN